MNTSLSVLYTGRYSRADQPGIHAYTFDANSVQLTERCSFTGITNPSFIVAHPNGRWLYAVSETSQQEGEAAGAVWALHLRREQWRIELINYQLSGGDAPCHLAIDPTRSWLLVSHYGSGSVGVLPITADGALGPLASLTQHYGSGPHAERQEGPHMHSVTFSPDQRFAIAADLGIDTLFLYTLDSHTGHLHEQTRITGRPGAGPRHATFHPDGKHLYVANELNSTVAVYHYDGERAALHEVQVISTLPPGADAAANTAADIHISPSSCHLYVSNRGHDTIAVFSIADDKHLSHQANIASGGRWPRSFAIPSDSHSDGHFLLVANQFSDELVVLSLHQPENSPMIRVAIPAIACVHLP